MVLVISIFTIVSLFLVKNSIAFLGFDFPNDLPPKTVSELSVEAYLGRWYQTHSSFIANQSFEKNGYCVTADYTGVSERRFNITNAQNKGSPTGDLSEIDGRGILPNVDEPGKWLITFDSDQSSSHHYPSEGSPYWIIKVGPINSDTNLYDYAVVSSPLGTILFILARDVSSFREKYQDSLLEDLKEQGFATPFNKPLETYQGSDCAYRQEDNQPKDVPQQEGVPRHELKQVEDTQQPEELMILRS